MEVESMTALGIALITLGGAVAAASIIEGTYQPRLRVWPLVLGGTVLWCFGVWLV